MANRALWAGLLLTVSVLMADGSSRKSPEIDKVLQSAVDQNLVPHVVAVAATTRGVVYEHVIGLKKDTIFAIASMTKPVTAVAVMQLAEAGKIKLDEPAATYAPELANLQVLENGALRPPKGAVTVRQLLTHTSGFGYEFMNRDLHDYVAAGKVPSMLRGDEGFLSAPLLFDPGARWEYGISTDWLGRIVEKVSGVSLEQYFRRHLFDPIGMPDSFFNVPPEKQDRVAPIFRRKEDRTFIEQPKQPMRQAQFFSGGAGLYSTAADYIKFAQALMAGGKRILKPESVAAMGQNQIGGFALHPMPSMMPELLKDRAPLGGLDKFGLGFALNSNGTPDGRGRNTMAWAGIYNTFFWIDREKSVCAVLMTQMLPFGDDGPAQLLGDFERAVYKWKP